MSNAAGDNLTRRQVAAGLGALLFLAFLRPATGTGTFFYRDFGVLAWPTVAYHHEMFWRGELPLWNPYSNCGVPFLAQWGTMTLYPFSLIYLVLPLPWSLNFFCLVHLWWGAVGTYRLACRWTDSSPASTVAATLFLFSGLTLGTLYWPNYTVALAWMPWILLFTEQAWKTGGPVLPLAAVTGTMQMLAGVPEVNLLTWLLAGAIWLPELLQHRAHAKRLISRPAAVIALIAGLSAIQLLPFFELLSLSHRQSGFAGDKWALPFTALGSFALPLLHALQTPQHTWFQHDQYFLSSIYIGLTALLLAAFGLLKGGLRAHILAIAGVLCVILALGPNLPTYALLQKLPLVGLARYSVKFTLLLALIIPLLAAYGIRALEHQRISAKHFAFTAIGFLLLACALTYWTHLHPLKYDNWGETLRNSSARLALFLGASGLLLLWSRTPGPGLLLPALLLLALDGRFHIENQNPVTEPSTLTLGQQERGLPKLGEGRVFISPEAEERFLNSNLPDLNAEFIGKQLAVWSHLNLVELVPKVNGSATLPIREQKEIQDALYSKTNNPSFNSEAWLDFLGVTQTTAPAQITEWKKRATALPLVRIASSVTNEQRELPNGEGKVESFVFGQNEVAVRVTAKAPATLLIAQTWHPQWRAEVNEKEEPVLRVNRAFQAVVVPAGESVIRLRYRPPWAGVIISFITLAACCGLLGRKSRAP